ncbi:ribonuclease Z [Arachidicoccus rhizosphaerae]|uniref:Ribonuclease Z n=1 Tax=Arachidicoccus rhizosphaerae TaxID=551991 RepID=A0A1H3VFB1_9BACT|nr:ribonuclease Z [Arachidicoccus rhizosphaerae]SDZ73420.1 ribonuclease Z [Arachidicoccus rhizosphaerae]
MFGVTILGNNSAVPAHDRHPTAQAVTIAGEVLLLDCGEGTQLQIKNYFVKRSRITRIFISHLHGDHYFGLIGLISSMALINRATPLHLYAPAPLKELIDLQLSISDSVLPYELIFHPLSGAETLVTTAKYKVEVFPVEHRIECYGFLIRENHAPRKIDPQKTREYEIPHAYFEKLQWGADYQTKDGRLLTNEMLTLPGKNNASYAYCADTLYTDSFLPYIQNVDLLYHESTYLDDFELQAKDRFHSTARQAAMIAEKASAGHLLLGHFSSKFKYVEAFEAEAREVFPYTDLSQEGVTYLV